MDTWLRRLTWMVCLLFLLAAVGRGAESFEPPGGFGGNLFARRGWMQSTPR